MLELVDAVLTFGRLTSGRLALERDRIAANEIMSLASDPMTRGFADAGVELRVASCVDEPVLYADRARAVEVLRHLLSNALKFTATGGTVTVGCSPSETTVTFAVTDSGRGIPSSQHEAIFRPFVRGEKGLTRTADGSGLGLAVGRELAVRMGGDLNVASEVGAGSTFRFTLPRAGRDG